MSGPNEFIGAIKVLQRESNKDYALELLSRAASQARLVMKSRGWKVKLLREFYPKDPHLLGLNINRGAEIRVRLRPHYNPDTFYDFDHVLGTLLHELVHIRIAPHNDAFQALLNTLFDEVEAQAANGYTGVGFYSDGSRLGTDKLRSNLTTAERQRIAADAADKRRHQTAVLGMGEGRRLGGCQPPPGAANVSIRVLAFRAAHRRLLNSTQCGGAVSKAIPLEEPRDDALSAQPTAVGTNSHGDDDDDDVEIVATRGPASPWKCIRCTFSNMAMHAICAMCTTPKPSLNAWICLSCTFANPINCLLCQMCEAGRP